MAERLHWALASGDQPSRRFQSVKAVIATVVGCALAWGGWLWPPLKPLYDYAWFVGFGAAFVVYALLMRGAPVRG